MLWIKALHLISMVCWFAALFYLPRLFVYHAMSSDKVSHERFLIMEKKLYRAIAIPSMILTLFFGIILLMQNASLYLSFGWMHAKLFLVVLLLVYHHLCGYYIKQFAAGHRRKTHIFFRWFNEVPVIMLVGIIILVVVKPF